MKKILLPVVAFGCTISAFGQLSNGFFEDWTKVILFEHPVMGIQTYSSNYETYFDIDELNVTEIERNESEGQALRIENLTNAAEVIPGYFILGNEPEMSGEDLIFGGGVPLSDHSMTGVEMDLRFHFPEGTSGFVLVQFKSNGTPTGPGNFAEGTSVFTLSGDQDDWQTMEFFLDEPVDPSVDQVVIAIASADVIADDQPFAAGAFVEVDNVEWIGSDTEIPGGHFNSWAQVTPVFVPDHCAVDIHPDHRNYEKSPDAYEGLLSLGVFTDEYNGAAEPGSVILGAAEDDEEMIPFIDITENADLLSFVYKYDGPEDVAEVRVVFFDSWNGFSEPVYVKSFDLQSATEFTPVEYTITSDLEANSIIADKMYIEFKSSKEGSEFQPMSGSYLTVDKVALSGVSPAASAAVRTALVDKEAITAYPNPTLGRAVFRFPFYRSGYYRVYNSMGAQIDLVHYQNTRSVIYDLYNLPDGTYTFRFYHAGTVRVVQVVKI